MMKNDDDDYAFVLIKHIELDGLVTEAAEGWKSPSPGRKGFLVRVF